MFYKNRKGLKGKKYSNDKGDLTQTIIIIAALAVASIVAIGGVSAVVMEKGEQTANCIANKDMFNPGNGTDFDNKCISDTENSIETPEHSPVEPPPGNGTILPPEYEEESCFVVEEDTIINYKIELEDCSTNVIIPQTINDVEIKNIGEKAFYSKGITSVVFPSTVISIGDLSFGYNNLKNLNIPNSVQSIGEGAFMYNKIENVYIPDNVEGIGQSGFYNNPIKALRITENEKYNKIERETFAYFCGVTGGCTGVPNTSNIEKLTIPDNIETIGNSSFLKMKIKEVTIPESVKEIDDRAFERTELEKVIFNDGLIKIGYKAFGSNKIENLVLPETLKEIGNSAFRFNRELIYDYLTIPQSVESIGMSAFRDTRKTWSITPTVYVPKHTAITAGHESANTFDSIKIVRY